MNELILILRRVKDKWGLETVKAILNEIDKYPILWKGTLRRSISYEQDLGLDGDISFNMADYGRFVDEGIGIFGPQQTKIPKQKLGALAFHLKEWSDSKSLNNWAVAQNIIKRGGIKPRPFFKSVIESRVPNLSEEIQKAYTDYLTNITEQQ
jgi:hypothetical protein